MLNNDRARSFLFGVGALPFWVGRKKLLRYLSGETGSYFEGETPLTNLYRSRAFFGEFEREEAESLYRTLNNQFIVRERVSYDKPFRVVKLTDAGVREYYNGLVMEHGADEPYWKPHHVARLTSAINSRMNTAGFYIEREGAYLSDRQGDDAAPYVRLIDMTDELATGRMLTIEQAEFQYTGEPTLQPTGETAVSYGTSREVGEAFRHFGTPFRQDQDSPYILAGKLHERHDVPDGFLVLFQNDDGDGVVCLHLPETRISGLTVGPNDLEPKRRYVFGPVEEAETTDHNIDMEADSHLTLKQNGDVRLKQPGSAA